MLAGDSVSVERRDAAVGLLNMASVVTTGTLMFLRLSDDSSASLLGAFGIDNAPRGV